MNYATLKKLGGRPYGDSWTFKGEAVMGACEYLNTHVTDLEGWMSVAKNTLGGGETEPDHCLFDQRRHEDGRWVEVEYWPNEPRLRLTLSTGATQKADPDKLTNDERYHVARFASKEIWAAAYGAAFAQHQNAVQAARTANQAVEAWDNLPEWSYAEAVREETADEE